MSYALHAYMVDVNSVQKVFGSKDEAFLNELVSSQKEKIQELRYNIDSEVSPIEALKEIFSGKTQTISDTAIYVHVCELLCAQLGTLLPCSEWEDLSMNWLMDVNMEASLPISEISLPKNFPYVLTILFDKIEDFIDVMGALILEEEEPWIQFESWVKLLKEQKSDLVVFFY